MNYGTQQSGGNRTQQPSAQPSHGQAGAASGQGASNAQGGVPPSYAEVVAGDHKVQAQN